MAAPTTYTAAIEVLLRSGPTYRGGLSNHGPMAVEALVSMDAADWIAPFVDDYVGRLEPGEPPDPAPAEWRPWLAAELDDLISNAGKHAGHGLLRTAHAARALTRAESATGAVDAATLTELAAGVRYWARGAEVLAGPDELSGALTAADWVAALPRLDPAQRTDGLLTETLGAAVAIPGFADRVAALQPDPDLMVTLDDLAHHAASAYVISDGIAAFTFIHGVTVPTMARQLVPILDAPSARRLVASVATFVAAAISGFVDSPPPNIELAVDDSDDLVTAAAATLDDHTIKFADACLGLAARTGQSDIVEGALRRRIAETRR